MGKLTFHFHCAVLCRDVRTNEMWDRHWLLWDKNWFFLFIKNERCWWKCKCTAYELMCDKLKIYALKCQPTTAKMERSHTIAVCSGALPLHRIGIELYCYDFQHGDNESHMSFSLFCPIYLWVFVVVVSVRFEL